MEVNPMLICSDRDVSTSYSGDEVNDWTCSLVDCAWHAAEKLFPVQSSALSLFSWDTLFVKWCNSRLHWKHPLCKTIQDLNVLITTEHKICDAKERVWPVVLIAWVEASSSKKPNVVITLVHYKPFINISQKGVPFCWILLCYQKHCWKETI